MDPFTAAGLAAAIVAFIDAGTKVATRVKELSDSGNVPEVFRDIRTRLPLIISIIGGARHATDNLSPEAEAAFEEIVRQCFKQITQLDEILEKVMILRGDSRLKKVVKAGISLVEEERVQRIAASLRDNVQLLTFLNVTPGEKGGPKADRRPSEAPPSYKSVTGAFLVPFSRDEQFVGRESCLRSIASSFEIYNRVAVSGMGGVG